ncbi:MAG: LTA synthase family protein [Flavobacteriales bacterium]|nr:LTA synthase family protein [Flavobacteriales bacterium]
MKYFLIYFKRILALLAIYTTSRIFLFFNNFDSFNNASILEFIEGLRFDFSALFYINIPLLLLLLIPHNFRVNKYYQKTVNWIFYGVNIPFILLNNVDIEYFKFTQKRSTTDFFQLLQLGDDAKNIIPQYMKDYWLITVFSFIQIWLLLKLKYIPKEKLAFKFSSIFKAVLVLILASVTFIIGARGGLQLKPIKPINAGELSNSQESALILNTPFCILHSFKNTGLKPYKFFSENELNQIYSPNHNAFDGRIKKKNIVILIMESYSKEFVGFYNEGKSYTPFLDSLMQHSLVFTNAYANGLKSIEALPAITASIPTLMTNPFITSDYAQNNFESIASLLNKEGYKTSFYHGGTRGTMGFYSFSKKAGFNNYYGMEEYNNNSDFDGTWGVFDGPFMQYFSNGLNSTEEPFFSTFFSLSSHPPYSLPSNYKSDSDEIGIRETIKYTDDAMAEFFKNSKNEPWFKNTIFIITADHTSGVRYSDKYKHKTGRIEIPMIFYSDGIQSKTDSSIVQQIDIMPTIFEMINYNKNFFAFGKSMFSEQKWAINKLYNQYRLMTPNGIIIEKNEGYKTYSDKSLKNKIDNIEEDIQLLKSIKQSYNQRMLNNKLQYED